MPNESILPVLIAGGGPTGLTAALELRRFGIPVRIVDEMEGPATTSRAVGIQARTLEEMELRGLAGEFLRLGNRAAGGDVYGSGKLLFRADFTRLPSRYNFLLFLSQTETERILREALEAEGAAVEWGVKMTAFGQDSTGITALLEHTDGAQEKVNASYFIDAEGAHSTIRTSLGLDFKGKTFNGNYALGDVHIDSSLVNSDFHIFASEYGFLGLFPMGGSHFRLIASDPPTQESTAAPPTLEELQAFYDQRSHIPARLRQLTWSSWFHINSRIVDNFRIGRAFMAGDAAHIHSPAGAQGMNTGIQDAINLGWKLALVLQGKAPETLLDTYQQDRLPVMRSIVANTERMTEIAGGDHPILLSFFVNMAPWIAGADFVQQNATARISQIAINYRNSPLSADHFAEGSLLAGDRVPDVSVRVISSSGETASRRLFSLLDPTRFTLLLSNLADSSSVPAQISHSLAPWHDLIAVIQIGAADANAAKPFQDCFGLTPSITLVRPDAYVGFRGSPSSVSKLPEYCKLWLTPGARQQAA